MHPILYVVDLFVDRELGTEFETWLFGHRDEMLTVDGFLDAQIHERETLDEDSERGQRQFSVQYVVRDRETLDRYLRDRAVSLRAEAIHRFGQRFSARRSVLTRCKAEQTGSEIYQRLAQELPALFEGERDLLANLANTTALLYERLAGVNWVGVYLRRGDDLVLGPFQGRSACVRIPIGKGVCGACAARKTTVIVPDVHAFEGHIACDARSRSEIVVPLLVAGSLLGVLDLDSPLPARFSAIDAAGLQRLVQIVLAASDMLYREAES